jgi:hypothetical protein
MIFRGVSLSKLEQVRGGLDVAMMQGDARISKSAFCPTFSYAQ